MNNSAAEYDGPAGLPAAPSTQVTRPRPTRACRRSLGSATASGPIAERTSPQEGSCIRARPPRKPGHADRPINQIMKTWTEHTCFAALDWAKDHHNVIVVDSHGRLLADFRFDHTAGGWTEFAEKMAAFPQCPLALETTSGPANPREGRL